MQGRSPLHRWLVEHYAAITVALASQSRPAWGALAKTAAEDGVLDINGNSPGYHAVRKAWKAIERAKAANPPTPPAVAAAMPRSVQAAQPVPPAAPSAPTPARPRNTFTVARFKRGT